MLTKLYVRGQNLLVKDEGASAVEYGLLVAGVAVAIIVLVFTLGDAIADLFSDVAGAIGGAGS